MPDYIDITNQCTFNPSHGSTVSSSGTLTVTYNDGEKDLTNNVQINSYPRSTFNSPYNISDRITNCYKMFNHCYNFNQPIIIPNSVTDCANMFLYCNNFNQQVIIPPSVRNTTNMFRCCNNLTKNITISNTLYYGDNMFSYCNGPLNVIYDSKDIYRASAFTNMFIGTINRVNLIFNNGPYSVQTTTQILDNLYNGSSVAFTKDTTNGCFYNTYKNIYVYGLNLSDAEWTLMGLYFRNDPQLEYASNMPFDFGNANLYALLNDGSTERYIDFDYDNPALTVSPTHTSNVLSIGSTATNTQILTVSYTLNGITKNATRTLNIYGNDVWTTQNYKISNNFTDCSNLFYNRRYYNGYVTPGTNMTNCYCMFRNCYNYDCFTWKNIPNKVTNCSGMFANCIIMNPRYTGSDSLNIPYNVTNVSYMFKGCSNFNAKLNIDGGIISDYTGMFIDCENYNRPITIGHFGTDITISELFRGCSSLNSRIQITAKNIINAIHAFRYCESFANDIEINCERLNNCNHMIMNSNFNNLFIFGMEYGNKAYINLENMIDRFPDSTYQQVNIYLTGNYSNNFDVTSMLNDTRNKRYDIYVNNFHKLVGADNIIHGLHGMTYEDGYDESTNISYNNYSMIFGSGGVYIHWGTRW